MLAKTPGLLWDIEDSARFIVDATKDVGFERYLEDRQLRLAVERSFGIIGVAARRLAGYEPDVAARLPGLTRVVALRDDIAHSYDAIDNATVWATIKEILPTLRSEAQGLLGDVADSER